jgi:nucleoside-diphosphate-sugar epimerase
VKALVTGGAGFIGSAIVRTLLSRGDDVRVLDNLLTGLEENLPEGAGLVRGDVRDLDAVRRACRGVEVIFHQAAVRSVPRSVDDPRLANDTNVTGTLNVLIAAAEAGVRRVVYASSSSVYGDAQGGVNREDMTPAPRSPYAVSKLAGEHYCRVWNELTGVSTVCLRYFNVFGPGQQPESRYSAVFPAFISALAAGRPPEVHWDGEQARDFTFVEDVARANLLAAGADGRVDGQVINIGAGRPVTVNEVLQTVSAAMGRRVEPVFCPRRPGDVRRTHADTTRARALLGWEPRWRFPEAVGATVEWFLKRGLSALERA